MFQPTQHLLETVQSFEELSLAQGQSEAGKPEELRATRILLSWQPESGILLTH